RTSTELSYTKNNNKYSVTNREDKGSTVSLSLNHRHGRVISSSLLFQREERVSDLISDSYTVNMARITVTAAF
ncbi:MAG: hypothetical protein KAU29_03130, partial [Gammaproteobacteria bacterium]|nr:hypothetical protein [Gammaproteobacteria bacterium]